MLFKYKFLIRMLMRKSLLSHINKSHRVALESKKNPSIAGEVMTQSGSVDPFLAFLEL